MPIINIIIYGDRNFRRMKIDIDPAGAYFWIERFVQQCRTSAMAQTIIDDLRQAINDGSKWDCNYNDVYAHYDPVRRLVIAHHELPDISTPPPSAMPVTDFIRILSDWMSCLE